MARRRTPADKRARILGAAAELMVENGYGATTLDAIVERAGCSKSAVYEYFGHKQGLISALAVELVQDLAEELLTLGQADLDIRSALTAYAERAMQMILTDMHMAVVRQVVAETWRYPELGHSYYALGPKRAQDSLAGFLRQRVGAGHIAIDDPARAAVEFYGLLLWDKWNTRLVGARRPYTRKQIQQEARHTVDAFLRLYPPRR